MKGLLVHQSGRVYWYISQVGFIWYISQVGFIWYISQVGFVWYISQVGFNGTSVR